MTMASNESMHELEGSFPLGFGSRDVRLIIYEINKDQVGRGFVYLSKEIKMCEAVGVLVKPLCQVNFGIQFQKFSCFGQTSFNQRF